MTKVPLVLPPTIARGGTIGIDPGSASGAIAYVRPSELPASLVWPIGDLTDAELWELISGLARVAAHAVIEQVGPMPKQGISSTWKFSANVATLRAMLTASGLRWSSVAPTVWQRAMRCSTRGDKRIARARAQQLFAPRKVRAVEADALLIAAYGATPAAAPPESEADPLHGLL